jgi:hypothetical protein
MTDGPVARLLWCALDALAQLLRHAITDDHYRSRRELLSAHRRCVARSQVVGRARRWGRGNGSDAREIVEAAGDQRNAR